MLLKLDRPMVSAGGIALVAARTLELRTVRPGDLGGKMERVIKTESVRIASARGKNVEFRMVFAEAADESGRSKGAGGACVCCQVIGISMAAGTIRCGAKMEAGVGLMFRVATEAGDVIRNAGRVMEVVPTMTFAAGAIHRREGEGGLAGEFAKMEQARRCPTCAINPGAQPSRS